MKAVMIRIQPKWVEKIAKGTKTIEVRKTRPKIDTPFKCYIYCTAIKPYLYRIDDDNNFELTNKLRPKEYGYVKNYNEQNGKVIGHFVCDRIEELHEYELTPSKNHYKFEKERLDLFLKYSCLSYDEICEYRKNLPYFKPLYGWHINDLVIYDEPKELFEFYPTKHKPMSEWTDNDFCQQCKYHQWIGSMKSFVERGIQMQEKCTLKKPEPICEYTPPLTRPPQSWCYVEEKE